MEGSDLVIVWWRVEIVVLCAVFRVTGAPKSVRSVSVYDVLEGGGLLENVCIPDGGCTNQCV
jgi:hypothetical protein